MFESCNDMISKIDINAKFTSISSMVKDSSEDERNNICDYYSVSKKNVDIYVDEMERLKARLVVDNFLPHELTIYPFKFLANVILLLKDFVQSRSTELPQLRNSYFILDIHR